MQGRVKLLYLGFGWFWWILADSGRLLCMPIADNARNLVCCHDKRQLHHLNPRSGSLTSNKCKAWTLRSNLVPFPPWYPRPLAQGQTYRLPCFAFSGLHGHCPQEGRGTLKEEPGRLWEILLLHWGAYQGL